MKVSSFKMKLRLFHLVCFAALTLVSACGGKFFPDNNSGGGGGNNGGGGNTNSGNYLYVANTNTNPPTIAGFTIANSKLSSLSGSPFNVGVIIPNAIAISPKNNFLYAGSPLGGIYLYIINNDGTLSLGNNGTPVATGVGPSVMKVDTTGNWLIAAQPAIGSNGSAFVFSINTSTGVLTTQGNPVGLDLGTPNRIVFTPNDQVLYIGLSTGGVDILTFASNNGTLNAPAQVLHPKTSNNSDTGLAVDPTGTYLFVTETGSVIGTKNGLRVLKIGTNGALSELSTSPVATGQGPQAVLVTASGSYVYVANGADDTVSAYSLSTTGALTPLANSPFPTGTFPIDLAEDKTGAYIAVACSQGNPDLQVFQIDTTTTNAGQLDPFATASTGTEPTNPSQVIATQ